MGTAGGPQLREIVITVLAGIHCADGSVCKKLKNETAKGTDPGLRLKAKIRGFTLKSAHCGNIISPTTLHLKCCPVV